MNTTLVDGIKIHTHVSGEQGAFVNACLVETPRGVVAVDGTLTRSESLRHRDALLALGKPLLAVLVTCPYPDHVAGIAPLVAGARVPVHATRQVLDAIRASEGPSHQRWGPMLGDEWIPSWMHPDHIVEEGQPLTIDGVTFHVHSTAPRGEPDANCLWTLGTPPRVAFVGDLVSHGNHAYIAERRLSTWLASLERAEALCSTCEIAFPGHGPPAPPAALFRWQRAYLSRYAAQIKDLSRGRPRLTEEAKQELTTRMEAFLPGGPLSFLVALSADAVAAELSSTRRRLPAPAMG